MTNTDPFGFAAAINDDVIDNLSPEDLAALADVFGIDEGA